MVELGWGVLGVTCGVCLVYQVRAVAVALCLTPQKADPPRSPGGTSDGLTDGSAPTPALCRRPSRRWPF